MTIEEIYSTIASRMIRGMMIHDQLANYYDFLGLRGYKRCHEYHFLLESCEYRSLNRYFINHHNKLIPENAVDSSSIIPPSWFNYSRQNVDSQTKRAAVKNGLQLWVKWERDTKKLYEKMYNQAISINQVASAFKIKELVIGVDCELKKAQRYHLNKITTDYDIVQILEEQKSKHDKYKKKMEQQIGVKIC